MLHLRPLVLDDDAQVVHSCEDWKVVLDDALGRFEVYLSTDLALAFVSSDTWDGLSGRAEIAFTDDYVGAGARERGPGLHVLPTGPGSVYGDAARGLAVAEGTYAVRSADAITLLEQRVRALLTHAQGLNAAPSLAASQMFVTRSAALQTEVAEQEARVASLRAQLDLAQQAVFGALAP